MSPDPHSAAERRPPALRLQVAAMLLVALLPVFWLIGRRTAPPVSEQPLLLAASEPRVTLQESARGLAANAAPPSLPTPAEAGTAYRLAFVPGGSAGGGQPPYRIRLEAPDGRDIWQASFGGPGAERGAAELLLPAAGLKPGRYALLVEDAAGTMRSFPFLVP